MARLDYVAVGDQADGGGQPDGGDSGGGPVGASGAAGAPGPPGPSGPPESAGEWAAVADRMRLRRGGPLTPLDAMLLHSPPVADGWNALLGAIRSRTTLPADLRELAILRVAWLNGAGYEWHAHEPAARAAGMSTGQIEALRDGTGHVELTGAQRATLAYTDAMTREVAVPDVLFDALAGYLDRRQIVELTATVGAYNLVSRFLVALRIEVADRDLVLDGRQGSAS